jgi:hypothetical protein
MRRPTDGSRPMKYALALLAAAVLLAVAVATPAVA